jgi:circadian clock protein KaiC
LSDVFQPVPKLETGVVGLDQIALGGLPRGRTTLVSGTTGTGKTLLALEFLARGILGDDEPGVFITFEERPEDIRRNAASLGLDIAAWEATGRWAFVNASDAGPESEEIVGSYDLGGLMARVGQAVRRVEAKRVSFDSLGAVFGRFADAAVVRFELQRVAAALKDLEVTSLLTAERTEEYGLISRFGIEELVADNVVVLRNVLERERRRRTVEVLKLRGAPHRTGEWLFTIHPKQGLVVLPLAVVGPGRPASSERVTTGIPELDTMCGGGLYRDAVAFVSGPTGIGKTLLTTHFVAAGVGAGERCVLVSFEESREQLMRNATSWGFDLEAMEAAGSLMLVCESPELASLEDHFLTVKQAVEDFRPTRLAVDNLSALERVATVRVIRDVVIGMGSFVKNLEVTTLFTATTGFVGGSSVTEAHLSVLTDTILSLRYAEVAAEMRRSASVVKMRGSWHDRSIREFTIDDHGMHIGEPLRGASGVVFPTAAGGQPPKILPSSAEGRR